MFFIFVDKVVENPIITVQSIEGAAQSAIQYFENMRNFLEAVKDMKLLTFEASDLEKVILSLFSIFFRKHAYFSCSSLVYCSCSSLSVLLLSCFLKLNNLELQGGSSSKVVDCILCLKGYYEWKQAGGIGVWRYGGTVRITSFPKGSPPSLVGSETTDDSLDESESSQFERLLEFLHLSNEVSVEESRTANVLAFLFDRFGLGLLQAYLQETNEIDDLPLNAMVGKTLTTNFNLCTYSVMTRLNNLEINIIAETNWLLFTCSRIGTKILILFHHHDLCKAIG